MLPSYQKYSITMSDLELVIELIEKWIEKHRMLEAILYTCNKWWDHNDTYITNTNNEFSSS